MKRNLRILLLIISSYLVGWVTADLLVPHVLAFREEGGWKAEPAGLANASRPAVSARQR